MLAWSVLSLQFDTRVVSPWDALLLPVSEGLYTWSVQALAEYSSSNTVSPMWTQQHGSWFSAVPLFSNRRVTQPQGHVSASPA